MSDLPCSPGLTTVGSQQVNLAQGDPTGGWVKGTRCISLKNSSAGGGDGLQYIVSICMPIEVEFRYLLLLFLSISLPLSLPLSLSLSVSVSNSQSPTHSVEAQGQFSPLQSVLSFHPPHLAAQRVSFLQMASK